MKIKFFITLKKSNFSALDILRIQFYIYVYTDVDKNWEALKKSIVLLCDISVILFLYLIILNKGNALTKFKVLVIESHSLKYND